MVDSSSSTSIINYYYINSSISSPYLSLSILTLFLLLHFYFLIKTASSHFSPLVTALSTHLHLTPSLSALTLLALGNGAPDLFSSVAALHSDHPYTGIAAILSAGAFVSAFVFGSVVIVYDKGTIELEPVRFVRDVFCYLVAVMGLFGVYLSGEVGLVQACGFVGFYLFFVGIVVSMDFGNPKEEVEVEVEVEMGLVDREDLNRRKDECQDKDLGLFLFMLRKVSWVWEVPVTTILKLTIPSTSPSEWSRFYASSNICICPLLLLYSLNSFIPYTTKLIFLIPNLYFPLWSIILFISISLAAAHFFLESAPPQLDSENILITFFAFIMSVFWISTMAGELLNCLAVIGTILNIPQAVLGLTVLAWGNSVGDLVADVSLARAGQPVMAMAGCFVGPMFNMLVGLGSALVIETSATYPDSYPLKFNVSIVVAFVFLLLSLMGSLLVVTWYRFRVPRFWGFCLVGLYAMFTLVSLVVARFTN